MVLQVIHRETLAERRNRNFANGPYDIWEGTNVYGYVYVYVYVFVYAYVYVFVHVHVYVYMHMYMYMY